MDDDGLPDGQGTLQYKNGAKYAGHFQKGELISGKFTLPEKDSYIGKFADNIQNGKGKFIAANGSIYDGEWKDGK